jgi:hypothetical protein
MRGYDGERFTAAHANHTGIRRLATATRIEAGPITSDRVLLHGNHGGVGFEAMVVVEIETCGGACGHARCRARTSTTEQHGAAARNSTLGEVWHHRTYAQLDLPRAPRAE